MRVSGQALQRLISGMRPRRGTRLQHDWLLWLLSEEDRRLQRLIIAEPLRDEGSDPYLRLLADGSPSVRLWAAVALGRNGGPGVAARLAMMLNDRRDNRLIGAIGLGHLRDARSMPHLVDALRHEDADLRLCAVVALGWLGAPAAPALGELRACRSRDRDWRVRIGCGHAIRCIRAELAAQPTELLAAAAPGGRGTEPEAAAAPGGRGTEPEAAAAPAGRGTELVRDDDAE